MFNSTKLNESFAFDRLSSTQMGTEQCGEAETNKNSRSISKNKRKRKQPQTLKKNINTTKQPSRSATKRF